MIRIALALAVVAAVMASAAAEELITAPDGKLIRLLGDGTWEYVVDLLEDLIAAAVNDANRRVENMTQEKMAGLTAGMNLPAGMKLPF